MYGRTIIKELKKKYSFRLVGGAEMGSWVEWTHSKVPAGGLDHPTFACRYTGRINWGVRHTTQPRVPVWGNKASNL